MKCRALLLPLAALTMSTFTACSKPEAPAASHSAAAPSAKAATPVKIGALMAMTGGLKDYGVAITKGVELAVAKLNAAGGVLGSEVTMVVKDTQTTPKGGADAAQKLIAFEKATGIVGALSSGVTLHAASVAINNRTLLLSPASTSPELTTLQDDGYVNRTVPSDALQCVLLAKLAFEQGFKSMGVLYVNNSYGDGLNRTFKQEFTKLGGKILKSLAFNEKSDSFRSEVQLIADQSPDAILLIAYPVDGIKILRQALEFKLASKFLLTDGMKAPEVIAQVGAKALEGTYGTAPAPISGALVAAFKADFKAQYGELPPKPYIDTAFDAAILIALAAQKAQTNNPAEVAKALAAVASPPGEQITYQELGKGLKLLAAGQDIDYQGVSGNVDLDENGDVTGGSYGVWQITGGKIVDVRVEVIK